MDMFAMRWLFSYTEECRLSSVGLSRSVSDILRPSERAGLADSVGFRYVADAPTQPALRGELKSPGKKA